MAKILIVETGGEIETLLKRRFSAGEVSVAAVQALDRLEDQFYNRDYTILIWDADAGKKDKVRELELLRMLSRKAPSTQVIVVSDRCGSFGANGIKADSFHIISRPIDEDHFYALLDLALKQESAGPEGKRQIPVPVEFEGMLGVSLPIREVFQRIIEAASTDISVLITGETGTGKDMVAAAIHKRSNRSSGPYVVVNTGAMSPELIASELFGHERGAYTGATETRHGHFEAAHGGTIFLDEITTMDEKAQVSLLRVLETKTFRRVGGEKDVHADVRVIAATNEDLEQAVREKRFREDLYYRLDVFRINIPPLRARPGGVTFLTDHYVAYFDAVYNKNVRAVSPEAYRCLRRYPWPGNVRELKNVIQRAILMAKGEELTLDLLPERFREAPGSSDGGPERFHVGMRLQDVEKEFIAMTLAWTGGNKMKTASVLGISRRTLYNKLKKYGLLQ